MLTWTRFVTPNNSTRFFDGRRIIEREYLCDCEGLCGDQFTVAEIVDVNAERFVLNTIGVRSSQAISVSDTVNGMTEHTVKHAIEPFFTSSPETGRVGLGRSMVHGFVNQSHGRLDIRSQPGKEIVVALQFPPDVSQERSNRNTCDVELPQVLIVEADESLARVLEKVVTQNEMPFFTAESMVDALFAIDHESPAIVICDTDPSQESFATSVKRYDRLQRVESEFDVMALVSAASSMPLRDFPKGAGLILRQEKKSQSNNIASSVPTLP